MSLFGLQVCSGNYQKITNTNAAAKKTANVQKQATTIFYNVIQITVLSHKNKDKYNEVT